MRNFVFLLSLAVGLATAGLASAAGTAQVNLSAPSTISISGVTKICQGEVPYARVNLLVNAPDKGLPGLVYVGSHDPSQRAAEFVYSGYWVTWNGGLFPPYQIVRSGLNDLTLFIPLVRADEKQGWRLYVGYGVLTTEAEQKVQQMIRSYQAAKTKLPDRQIPAIDPDHFRQTLIQIDMTDKVKYRYVMDWTSDLISMCVPAG